MSTPPSAHLSRAASIAVIRVAGRDARTFLHAQLTQDLLSLEPDALARAAWLDPQGRVLACFDVVNRGGTFDLLAPAALAEALAGRLRLFVLRAVVTIEVVEPVSVVAVTGATEAFLERTGIPAGPSDPRHCVAANADWLRIAPGLAIGYGAEPPVAGAAEDDACELAEIRLGRAQVDATTQAQFTAHMLNLDLAGAVAFTKGCYPGQEIVARTEHRGAVRRRLYGFSTVGAAAPGLPVGTEDGEEVGTVLRAAPAGDRVELLAVVRTEAVDEPLRLGRDGPGLERLPVPGEP